MSNAQDHKIDWVRTIAGALAAVATAVLLSRLGAAGTLIGAALGSAVMSIVTSMFASGIARGRRRVADAQASAARHVGVAQAELRRASRRTNASEAHLEHADEVLRQAQDELAVEPPPSFGERLRVLSWPRIAVYAAGLFVVVVAAITAFELVAGEPVSSLTGGTTGRDGTSITRLGGGGHKAPAIQPSTLPTPSMSTSPSPVVITPTSAATPTPSAQPTETTAPSPPASPTDTLTPVVPSAIASPTS